MIFATTPSQTVGPYYSIGLPWQEGPLVVPEGTPGAIRIGGMVFDGGGAPIPDHLVETWQADPHGSFADMHGAGPSGASRLEGFRGFGRSGAEVGDGSYQVVTVKPGRVPVRVAGGESRLQAPHIVVSLFARGMLHRTVTRIYFADEDDANAEDPVLRSVSPARRATLLAQPVEGGYRLDIHLQGPHETVFFSV